MDEGHCPQLTSFYLHGYWYFSHPALSVQAFTFTTSIYSFMMQCFQTFTQTMNSFMTCSAASGHGNSHCWFSVCSSTLLRSWVLRCVTLNLNTRCFFVFKVTLIMVTIIKVTYKVAYTISLFHFHCNHDSLHLKCLSHLVLPFKCLSLVVIHVQCIHESDTFRPFSVICIHFLCSVNFVP